MYAPAVLVALALGLASASDCKSSPCPAVDLTPKLRGSAEGRDAAPTRVGRGLDFGSILKDELTNMPTAAPAEPTAAPTTAAPTANPGEPTDKPTAEPTAAPTVAPTTAEPTTGPTAASTAISTLPPTRPDVVVAGTVTFSGLSAANVDEGVKAIFASAIADVSGTDGEVAILDVTDGRRRLSTNGNLDFEITGDIDAESAKANLDGATAEEFTAAVDAAAANADQTSQELVEGVAIVDVDSSVTTCSDQLAGARERIKELEEELEQCQAATVTCGPTPAPTTSPTVGPTIAPNTGVGSPAAAACLAAGGDCDSCCGGCARKTYEADGNTFGHRDECICFEGALFGSKWDKKVVTLTKSNDCAKGLDGNDAIVVIGDYNYLDGDGGVDSCSARGSGNTVDYCEL